MGRRYLKDMLHTVVPDVDGLKCASGAKDIHLRPVKEWRRRRRWTTLLIIFVLTGGVLALLFYYFQTWYFLLAVILLVVLLDEPIAALLLQMHHRPALVGTEAMIGKSATVVAPFEKTEGLSELRGKVQFNGELWSAEAELQEYADLALGQEVRIRSVRGLVLKVESRGVAIPDV